MRMGMGSLVDEALVPKVGIAAEVDQKTKLHPGCLQIVDQLSAMPVRNLLNSLYLDNDFVETHEIRPVHLLQFPPAIGQMQARMLSKRNPPLPAREARSARRVVRGRRRRERLAEVAKGP